MFKFVLLNMILGMGKNSTQDAQQEIVKSILDDPIKISEDLSNANPLLNHRSRLIGFSPIPLSNCSREERYSPRLRSTIPRPTRAVGALGHNSSAFS